MWGVSDLGVVKYLVEQGAEVNAKDNAGETTLMKAAVSGRLSVVRYLLDKGATVDAGAERGGTRRRGRRSGARTPEHRRGGRFRRVQRRPGPVCFLTVIKPVFNHGAGGTGAFCPEG